MKAIFIMPILCFFFLGCDMAGYSKSMIISEDVEIKKMNADFLKLKSRVSSASHHITKAELKILLNDGVINQSEYQVLFRIAR